MKVAVLLGGNSNERDVSIASGTKIIQALRLQGMEVVAVDTAYGVLSTDQEKHLLNQKINNTLPDVKKIQLEQTVKSGVLASSLRNSERLKGVELYFIALHGGTGENGFIQALLDSAGLVYTGSGQLACANAMDKKISKNLMVANSIPTPPWICAEELNEDRSLPFDFPIVVKPRQQGSSIGLSVVRSLGQLADALALAYQFGSEVIIEKFISGRELTVGVLDGSALAVGEIILPDDTAFDYSLKYQPGAAKEIFPADVPQDIAQRVKSHARRLHSVLKLTGYSRSDFRLDEKGNIWCLEANTLPGMTAQSLFPQSAAAVGISFPELCRKICDITIRDAISLRAMLPTR